MPEDRWDYEVSGIAGGSQPVRKYVEARWREVEIHHFDLDAGYASSDWPPDFVSLTLAHTATRISDRVAEPFEIHATDLDARHTMGEGPVSATITGPGHELLAWLTRNRPTPGLSSSDGALPDLPKWG
jgi:maleylpyruvate isomerase